MLKILVTGDNHIGRKYASHPEAEKLIAERISAFDVMVDTANREECGLFVITGDLFDSTGGVTVKCMKSLLEKLSRFRGHVAVLPGNHDYYDGDVKVWRQFLKLTDDMDNILLMTEYRPYPLTVSGEEVVLYPALCTSLHSAPNQNNLGWIKGEGIVPDSAYRIGVAHGAVAGESLDNEGQYFLMERSELEEIPVDAWLTGHTHVPFPKNIGSEFAPCERVLNAGTHVQTDVSCNTEGGCFILEISADKSLRAKRFIPSALRFVRKSIPLTAGSMERILDRELGAIGDYSVVDIELTGAVDSDEYRDRASLIESRLARFLESRYSDSGMSCLITEDFVKSEFPQTSVSAQLLLALVSEPKEAQLVYELLKKLKEGK